MKHFILGLLATAFLAGPAAAQDFQPSFDGATQNQQAIAQSQIGGHMVR